ncbi:MAG: hypothetical protein CEO19_429 [Parcubacteria group bacterium Gr01-1014_73]|nr:MAG: hypothetical protein CEO19_429 [Parcubacteria group bacterium Gr01-1014_73]
MIAEILKKGKEQLAILERPDFFFGALIILVAFASFGLGRLSKVQTASSPIKIEQTAAVSAAVANSETKSAGIGIYVASKNGTKYHFPWCAGAKSISEVNKIWFNTVEEARVAGYAPASNCKGLK